MHHELRTRGPIVYVAQPRSPSQKIAVCRSQNGHIEICAPFGLAGKVRPTPMWENMSYRAMYRERIKKSHGKHNDHCWIYRCNEWAVILFEQQEKLA